MSHLAHCILGITAHTAVHAGSGSADDVIDLPIQREAHTDWPCVFGSSVKGALRARAEQMQVMSELTNAAFGPDTANAADHAGSLLVSDARLLLLPVRSLNSHFKRVTCPALLRRLARDLDRLEHTSSLTIPAIPPCSEEAALSATGKDKSEALFLEEFRFAQQDTDLSAWIDVLCAVAGEEYRDDLKDQLVIVSDDSFRHLCRSALPVQPHIRLNSQTKTVDAGALWYEESLPPETLLYIGVSAHASRSQQHKASAPELLAQVNETLFSHPWLQLGGNETQGMGWCKVNILEAE